MPGVRITEETLKVVAAIAHLGEATPPQLRARTKLASGTVSPILARLEAAGWLAQREGKGGTYWRIADEAAVRGVASSVAHVAWTILEAIPDGER